MTNNSEIIKNIYNTQRSKILSSSQQMVFDRLSKYAPGVNIVKIENSDKCRIDDVEFCMAFRLCEAKEFVWATYKKKIFWKFYITKNKEIYSMEDLYEIFSQ